MIFESHAHYDDRQFESDRDTLLNSLQENGIEYVVNIGSDVKTTRNSIELAKKYPFIYAAAGIHPSEVKHFREQDFDWLKAQAAGEKCVAIGEIGLDYYWDKEKEVRDLQKYWFVRQLDLAREVNLPLVIHSRDAAKDTLDIIKEEKAEEIGGVIHCFSYSPEIAREYVEMGFYIGIGGVVTFSNAKSLKQVARETPLEKILLETDCPYLAPVPGRGKRNSSLNLIYVAKEIAKIKNADYREVIDITCNNGKAMYRI